MIDKMKAEEARRRARFQSVVPQLGAQLIDKMKELFFFFGDISRPHSPDASSYHGSDVSFRLSLVLSLQTFIVALAITVYVVACPWI